MLDARSQYFCCSNAVPVLAMLLAERVPPFAVPADAVILIREALGGFFVARIFFSFSPCAELDDSIFAKT